ncbi:LOW QUALITY PROTEIN: hypothetical protein CVT25_013609 [Psilocybe cyanescens]|uniref:YMC020W-like alpha/beta hydrolase domain-containing protein n=1 Tax=Psilocybe cyanescens TaxID=93625 RepID=A0A409WT18_PSICY|nr:LOW QUALITY PROTEIN: hypothetical protein CVT25_013609 [Psilocybe cyanescens]
MHTSASSFPSSPPPPPLTGAAGPSPSPSRRHPNMNRHQHEDYHRTRRQSTTKSVRSTHTMNMGYNKQPSWRTGLIGTSAAGASATTAPASLSTSPEAAATAAAISASASSSRISHPQPQPLEASVSIVFAEREHSAPLAGARESTRHRLLSLSSTSSNAGSVGRRDRQVGSEGRSVQDGLSAVYEPAAAAAQESDANGVMSAESDNRDISSMSVDTSEASDSTISTSTIHLHPHPHPEPPSQAPQAPPPPPPPLQHSHPQPHPQTPANPNPNTHPPPSAPPSPSSSSSKLNPNKKKGSWFSSLTRSKGKSAVQAASSSSLSKTTSPRNAADTAAHTAAAAPVSVFASQPVPNGDEDGDATAAATTTPPVNVRLWVDPPTPAIEQEPRLPPLSPSPSSPPPSPPSPQLRRQTPIPRAPPPARADVIPIASHNAKLASGSGSGAGASISLPSSPLKHHHLRRHLLDDSSAPSSPPSPAPYIALATAAATAAAAASSSTTSLPLPVPATTTIAPKPNSASSSSSPSTPNSKDTRKPKSKPKGKSTRSWFYSAPPTPPASPPRSVPGTPPPGYAALPVVGNEGGSEGSLFSGAGAGAGGGGEEEGGKEEGKEGTTMSFEGWMEGKIRPVHAGPVDVPSPSSDAGAVGTSASTSISTSMTVAATVPAVSSSSPANPKSASSSSSTSTSTPGPLTPTSRSPSQPETQQERPRPRPRPTHKSTLSLPSSIDDSVPSLPHTPPAGALFAFPVFSSAAAAAAATVAERERAEEAGKQGGSRFMGIPLPLLGRAKVALPVPLPVPPLAMGVVGILAPVALGGLGGHEKDDADKDKDKDKDKGVGANESGQVGESERRMEQCVEEGGGGAVGGRSEGEGGGAGAEESKRSAQEAEGARSGSESRDAGADGASSFSNSAMESAAKLTAGAEPASAEQAKTGANAYANGNASWWDYVGWKSGVNGEGVKEGGDGVAASGGTKADAQTGDAADKGTTEDVEAAEEVCGKAEPEPAEVDSVVAAALEPPAVVEAPVSAEEAGKATKEGVRDADANAERAPGDRDEGAQTGGVASPADSESSNITSAWLAPWAWYYSSAASTKSVTDDTTTTTTTAVVNAEAESGAEAEVQEEEGKDEKEETAGSLSLSPAEAEHESDAGAVVPYAHNSQAQAQAQTEEAESGPGEGENPIMSTMDASRLGWASFFSASSNRLLVKTLAYAGAAEGAKARKAIQGGDGDDVKRDENGMEVMDIDDDGDGDGQREEEGEGARGRAVSRSAEKATPKAEPTRPSSYNSNSNSHSNGARSRSSNKRDRAAPLLVVSADLKRESARLSASGASTPRRSGSGANTPVPRSPSSVVSGAAGGAANSVAKTGGANASGVTTTTTTTSSSTATTTTSATMSSTNNSGTSKTTAAIASESTKRSASPAPSSTSSKVASSTAGSVAPPPPPPNLVLPTWADTFHAPPRNILPPRPRSSQPQHGEKEKEKDDEAKEKEQEEQGVGKLFGKTMKFVSGVLFARDASSSSSQVVVPSLLGSGGAAGKGKQRASAKANVERDGGEEDAHDEDEETEMGLDTEKDAREDALARYRRARMRGFGMALPKAWKVYEDAGWDVGGGSSSASPSNSMATMKSRSRSNSTSRSKSRSRSRSRSRPRKEIPAVDRINDTDPFDGEGQAQSEGMKDVLRGCKRVVVIGVHGWFPGAMIRTVLGEVRFLSFFLSFIHSTNTQTNPLLAPQPTGTSAKFAHMSAQALRAFEAAHGVKFEKVTQIPLEGEGVIERRVDRIWVWLEFGLTVLFLFIFLVQLLLLLLQINEMQTQNQIKSNQINQPHRTAPPHKHTTHNPQPTSHPHATRHSARRRLYATLLASPSWLADVHAADAVLVATHSQGSVVSAHLLARMYRDGHLVSGVNVDSVGVDVGGEGEGGEGEDGGVPGIGAVGAGAGAPGGDTTKSGKSRKRRKVQRVCLLALCGIHLGPLRYLSSSTLVGPYLQYFESTAARELFEFQTCVDEDLMYIEHGERGVEGVPRCRACWIMVYVSFLFCTPSISSLYRIAPTQTKILYIASLNDQVVPLYSGLFTAASHPLILRALYIDGDAYHSSDFLSALLVLLLRIRNAGLSDAGLLAHLSEATAGSLSGVGHSTAYEEEGTYRMAVDYLFLADEGRAGDDGMGALSVEPFNAAHEQNDYEIPWSLRDIIADERVAHFFSREIADLRDAFREWHPKTSILRDLKRKLQPIQRLGAGSLVLGGGGGVSKL